MRPNPRRLRSNNSGQSLVETAIAMPLLLCIVLNSINFAYFFLMAVNLSATPRTAAMYSAQGSATPAATTTPSAGPSGSTTCGTGTSSLLYVCFLAGEDMRGAINSPTTNASIQVCTVQNGVNNATSGKANQTTKCTNYGATLPSGFSFPTPASDPEANFGGTATAFLLNRVDIYYQFHPLIPGQIFNLAFLTSPICKTASGTMTCVFHRQASMRVMN